MNEDPSRLVTETNEDAEETTAYRHLRRGFYEVIAGVPRRQSQSPLQSKQPANNAAAATGAVASSSSLSSSTSSLVELENRRVLVYFLDPGATTSISARNSMMNSMQQRQRPSSLNEKFERIFQSAYQNCITGVPYQDARSKVSQTIPYVHVNCRFLESQVDLLQTHEDDINEAGEIVASPFGGGGGSSWSKITNTWHTRPYCYVYFVTGCPSVEEYRVKVKPAIQVFLSQLDDLYQRQSMQLSAGAMAPGEDDSSPSFLIIYCPTRTPGSPPILPPDPNNHHPYNYPTSSGADAGGGGGGIAGADSAAQRFASLSNAFRPRQPNPMDDTSGPFSDPGSETAATASGSSSFGDYTSPTGGTTAPDSSSSPTFNPSVVLTKVEKEVARRLTADFPQGTVATITTLANDYHSFVSYGNNVNLRNALEELERNEWAALLAAMSKAIVRGFDTICRQLWGALRKISNQQRDHGCMGHYFLLKESLAFTYRQMNLPAESLLQYNELRAFLPDLKKMHAFQNPHEQERDVLAGITGVRDRKKPVLAPHIPIWEATADPTLIRSVRERIGTLHYEEYYMIASAVELYLWERETSLLFQIGHTVQVLNRCFHFCIALWDYESKQKRSEGDYNSTLADEWAFSFCWDVRRAAQEYLVFLEQQQAAAAKSGQQQPQQPQSSLSSQRAMTAELFGRQMCEIMAFARSRLHRLEAWSGLPPALEEHKRSKYKDISKPWNPWTPSASSSSSDVDSPATTTTTTTGADSLTSENSNWSLSLNGQAFLQSAFGNNAQDYLTLYMDAMKVLIQVNNFCGRHRSAARFTMEMVDLHLERGNVKEAAQALQTVAKVYGRDGWGACHFLVHFRLAGFRRCGTDEGGSGGVSPREYLATLVHCFSRYSDGSSDSVAPQKALELLCQDFEAVMAVLSSSSLAKTEDSSATGLYSNSPIFDVNFKLPDAKKRKVFASQRKLPRKVFSVGDTVKITIGINSHLPREIGGIALSASLVPHKAYLAAQKQKRPVPPKDIFHTIELPDQVFFNPGENEFELQWTPMISGQFVLSQVTVCYKSANFVYSNDKMKELGFWLDILPVEPSQSLFVSPLFLIPGHKQRLNIEFRSGKDHVEEGELTLICTSGLVVLPPEEEALEGAKWVSSWKCPLKECPRGESQTFSVSVAGDTSESADDSESSLPPSVQVKVTTKFRHGNQEQSELFHENNESASAHFQHEMESIVPTIANSALTVESASLTPYTDSKAVLSVSAKCHVPAPFVLKNWNLVPPSFLSYVDDPESDLNIAAKDTSLIDGESISFAFDCTTVSGLSAAGKQTEQPLLTVELQDEHGGTFNEKMYLRLKKPTALAAMAKLQQVHRMVVRVKLTSREGKVGEPVQLTYLVDPSAFAKSWEGRISYTLDTNHDAWLVVGATKGAVPTDVSEWQLSFDAIPTAPGAISQMPSITFTFADGGLGKPYSITLPITSDEEFHSLLPVKHSIVAFPASSG
ncbi:hypothetical protein ACA910_009975 [Epithemia clementina (nom. ined.)]